MEIEEGGEGNRYNFPSQRKFDVNEIEPALRRQKFESKCKKIDYLFWALMLGLLIVSILHFVVEPLITPVTHAEDFPGKVQVSYQGKNFTPGSFCAQAVLDHASWGRDISQDLKDYCELN